MILILSFLSKLFYLNFRVKDKLAPASTREVLESDFFTFTVVRHPFDRILSAFRDRILRGCGHQAKRHIPRILGSAEVEYDKEGCVATFPTFIQFVKYITSERGKDGDPHWMRYSAACAPCLVSYDAIVKLETSEEDEVRKNVRITLVYVSICSYACTNLPWHKLAVFQSFSIHNVNEADIF